MFQMSLEWKFSSFPVHWCFSCLCAFLLVLGVRVYLNFVVCSQGDIPLPLVLTKVFVTKLTVSTAAPAEGRDPWMCSGCLSLGFPVPNMVPCPSVHLSSSWFCSVPVAACPGSLLDRRVGAGVPGDILGVFPSTQEVSAGPGLSDGSSFVLQTHLLGSWGCFRRGASNPGWHLLLFSSFHWPGF